MFRDQRDSDVTVCHNQCRRRRSEPGHRYLSSWPSTRFGTSRTNPMRRLLLAQTSSTSRSRVWLLLRTYEQMHCGGSGGACARDALNGRRRDALYPRSPIAFLTGALSANVVYAHLNVITHRGFGMHDRDPARKADHCGHGPLQRSRSGSPR
jgi:hypothetical protein